MAYIIRNPHKYVGKPFVGNGQCAVLAQVTGKGVGVPLTCLWTRGKNVGEFKPGELMPGTVIATFNKNQDYVSTHAAALSHQFHTALYVGHTVDKAGQPLTMTIVEQFVDKANTCQGKVRQRTIRFAPSAHISRDARNYYVVEHKGHSTAKPEQSRYEISKSIDTAKSP